MLKLFSFNFLLKAISIAITLSISIIIARLIGSTGLYDFTLMNRWFSILAIITLFGGDSFTIKTTARNENVNQNICNCLSIMFYLNLFVIIIVSLAYLFLSTNYLWILFLSSTLVIPYGFIKIYSSYKNGKNEIVKSIIYADIFVNLLVLILLFLTYDYIKSFNAIYIIYIISRTFVSIIVINKFKKINVKSSIVSITNFVKLLKENITNAYNSFISIFHSFNSNILVFIGIIFFDAFTLGNISLSIKFLTIFLIPMQVFNSMNANVVSRKYNSNKIVELNAILKKSSYLNLFVFFFGVIVFYFTHPFIISIWGEEFIGSVKYFYYLLFTYFVFSVTLPVDTILIMTNNEKTGFLLNLIFTISLMLSFYINFYYSFDSKVLFLTYASIVLIFSVIKLIFLKKKTNIAIL